MDREEGGKLRIVRRSKMKKDRKSVYREVRIFR
jgi:hypothetical protein